MKKEYDNIEDLFRESLNGYRIEPSKDVWKKINFKLDFKDFFLPNFKSFNIYYFSAITGLFISLMFLFSNETNLKNQELINSENSTQTEKLDIPVLIKDKKPNHSKKNKRVVSYITEVYTKNDFKVALERQNSNLLPLPLKNNLKEFSKIYGDSINIGSIAVQPPKPLFTIENKAGCAPFEINLKNQTKGAQYFEWTFGDGNKSNSINPTYTYQYPGIYNIKLKAIGSGGIAYCIIDSVIVYDLPKNKINWAYQSDIIEGQKIELITESQNSVKYQWDFGDGTSSFLKKPGHVYNSAGQYSISLKTWSEKNCMDSTLVANITVVKLESMIVFPNAFCPNPNGPSSGKYSGREVHNDIFHPLVIEEIAEYELKIYTKEGLLIYESKDVRIGWDGYYRNQRMPEGVYPFMAKGKFEGGRDFFNKGNVTILYKK